jgi:torulene dioxygenase
MLQVCDAKTLMPKRMLNYGHIDDQLSGYGICAHPPKDRARGLTYNYLISQEGVMYVFGMDIRSNPVKILWKTALPCPPCYIHSLAMTDKYVVFIRNVSLDSPRCRWFLGTYAANITSGVASAHGC